MRTGLFVPFAWLAVAAVSFTLFAQEPSVTNIIVSATLTNDLLGTWIGSPTGSGNTAANWDTGTVPKNTFQSLVWNQEMPDPDTLNLYVTNTLNRYDIRVDNNPAQNSAVTLTADVGNWTNGFVTVNEADSMTFSHTSTISVQYRADGLSNAGFTQVRNISSENAMSIGWSATAPYAVTNAVTGTLLLAGYSGGRNRCNANLNLNANLINDGSLIIQQPVRDRSSAALSLSSAGMLVNNGLIQIRTIGGRSAADSKARISFYEPAFNVTTVLTGAGSLMLWEDGKPQDYPIHVEIGFSSYWHTLTNGPDHTIVGSGLIDNCCLANAGLVLQTGTNGVLDIRQPIMYSDVSSSYRNPEKKIINLPGGRIVASGPLGLALGNTDTTASRPNKILNYGLLEARTGSFISYRLNSTQGSGTSMTTIPAILVQSGTWAGGGEFRTRRPLQLDDAAVLAPGDIQNTNPAITNGLGTSTAGLLTFTNALILSESITLDFQFAGDAVRGETYDSVAVNSTLTLDGTLNISTLPGFRSGGRYTLFTCAPGGLTDNGLHIGTIPAGCPSPLLTVDTEAGLVTIMFPSRGTMIMML